MVREEGRWSGDDNASVALDFLPVMGKGSELEVDLRDKVVHGERRLSERES
jgi:hypothetical protein